MSKLDEILPRMSVGQPASPYADRMSVGKPALIDKEKLKQLEKAASKKKFGKQGKQNDKPGFLENEKAMEKLGSAASQAAQTLSSQKESQALIGGVTTGLSTAGALAALGGGAAAFAGPAGIALGAITAFEGMASARKAKRAQREAQAKAEREMKRQRELELLEKNQNRRQRAIDRLMQAF